MATKTMVLKKILKRIRAQNNRIVNFAKIEVHMYTYKNSFQHANVFLWSNTLSGYLIKKNTPKSMFRTTYIILYSKMKTGFVAAAVWHVD